MQNLSLMVTKTSKPKWRGILLNNWPVVENLSVVKEKKTAKKRVQLKGDDRRRQVNAECDSGQDWVRVKTAVHIIGTSDEIGIWR